MLKTKFFLKKILIMSGAYFCVFHGKSVTDCVYKYKAPSKIQIFEKENRKRLFGGYIT